MATVSVVKLKVRRGTDAQRKLITLDQGELGFVTDSGLQRLFVGDGITKGGIAAGSKFITASTGISATSTGIQTGDLVYDPTNTTSQFWILTGNPSAGALTTALSSYKGLYTTYITQYGSLSASIIGSQTPIFDTNTSPLIAYGASKQSVYETLQNVYAGASASTDITLYNDTSAAYADFGICSSLYDGNQYSPKFNVTRKNDSYLFSVSGNLVIGTTTPLSGDLVLFTGGTLSGTNTSTPTGNERLRILNTGNVGIGTSAPNKPLTIVGDVSATGFIYSASNPSTATDITVSTPFNFISIVGTCSAVFTVPAGFRFISTSTQMIIDAAAGGTGTSTAAPYIRAYRSPSAVGFIPTGAAGATYQLNNQLQPGTGVLYAIGDYFSSTGSITTAKVTATSNEYVYVRVDQVPVMTSTPYTTLSGVAVVRGVLVPN